MIKILFVCYGNICRSPMAEFIFKKLIKDKGLDKEFEIDSAATSIEEIGNDIYPPARECLNIHGVPIYHHNAKQITKNDLDYYDYIITMEENNRRDLIKLLGDSKKYSLLLDYTDKPGDIDDPWTTRDFETAYSLIEKGCIGLLFKMLK